MRILVVEDDPKTSTYLKKGLTENSFIVDTADNGTDGLFYACNYPYNLVILDLMLPLLDGFHIVKSIRAENKVLPLLMLSGCDAVEDRIQGLQLGADDYLTKPFSFSELLARINCLLRRSTTIQHPLIINIADLEINLREHKVSRAGERIVLTPKEFALLALLAKHQGELLSRSVITEHVWDMDFNCDTNVVDVMIRRIRNKVDAPFKQKLIHTLRGVGYVMEER